MLQLRVLGAFVVGENCWQTRKASWEPFLELPPVLPRHICCPEVSLEGLEVDGLEEGFLGELLRAFLVPNEEKQLLCSQLMVCLQLNCKSFGYLIPL